MAPPTMSPGASTTLAPIRPGVWERFLPHVGAGPLYKYAILPRGDDRRIEKADPCAFAAEAPPGTASRVWDLAGYDWGDADWMATRGRAHALDAPIATYEVHLGSWRKVPEEGNRWIYFLAPWGLQFELVCHPNGTRWEREHAGA